MVGADRDDFKMCRINCKHFAFLNSVKLTALKLAVFPVRNSLHIVVRKCHLNHAVFMVLLQNCLKLINLSKLTFGD